MLNLILAIVFSSLIAVVMRVGQRFSRNNITMLAANYVMCTVAAVFLAGGLIPTGEGAALTMGLGSFCGVLYLLGFVLFQWNIHRSGVVLSSTFQKLGVLVPTIAAMTVFGEAVRWVQLAGIAVAVLGIIVIQDRADKSDSHGVLGLLILLLCGGCGDVMSKVFQTWGNPALGNYFLVFTFLVALVLCIGLCVVKKQSVTLPDVLWGFALGLPNYMASRFLLRALAEVPAVVVYPTFSVGTIIVVTLIGVLAFHEKVNKRKIIALGMILSALVLLNV